MKAGRPRTKSPEARRAEILDAAQGLFLERGAGPTTIEQITAAAEVAKGTFYLYFQSKAEVLEALEARFAQDQLAKLRAAVAQKTGHNWEERLAAWARAATAVHADSARLHDLLFYEARPAVREDLSGNIVAMHLLGLLEGGAAEGAWAVEDCRATAVFLYSGLHGLVGEAMRRKRVDLKRLQSQMVTLFFRAMGLRAG